MPPEIAVVYHVFLPLLAGARSGDTATATLGLGERTVQFVTRSRQGVPIVSQAFPTCAAGTYVVQVDEYSRPAGDDCSKVDTFICSYHRTRFCLVTFKP